MDTANRCPDCGAIWRTQRTCRDHFDQMLAWEFENPDVGDVAAGGLDGYGERVDTWANSILTALKESENFPRP